MVVEYLKFRGFVLGFEGWDLFGIYLLAGRQGAWKLRFRGDKGGIFIWNSNSLMI